MKKDNFIKGILVGVMATLMFLMMTGFGSSTPGHNSWNPMYVKIVK